MKTIRSDLTTQLDRLKYDSSNQPSILRTQINNIDRELTLHFNHIREQIKLRKRDDQKDSRSRR